MVWLAGIASQAGPYVIAVAAAALVLVVLAGCVTGRGGSGCAGLHCGGCGR